MPDTLNLQEEKRRIRAVMRQRREGQAPDLARERGAAAQAALMAERVWQEARQVALYVAFRGEAETDVLLHAAWAQGRQILLPRCRRDTPGIMDFVLCAGIEDLQPGHFGILEPRGDLPALDWGGSALAPDILIIPGVAFDRKGGRLGFGGGYYDRALAKPALRASVRVGLAFSWQVVDALPAEDWDFSVQCLCTEEGCTWL